MSTRCEWWLSSLFLLAGVGLLGSVAYVYYAPPSDPGPTLEVQTDVAITCAVAGTKQEVSLRLHNRTHKAMRVLGLVEC